jgi:hypothetical protein
MGFRVVRFLLGLSLDLGESKGHGFWKEKQLRLSELVIGLGSEADMPFIFRRRSSYNIL